MEANDKPNAKDWLNGNSTAVIEHEVDESGRLIKGCFNPGNFRFKAAEMTIFTISDGSVQENSTGEWRAAGAGDNFTAFANRHFEIRCAQSTGFKCDYFDPTDG